MTYHRSALMQLLINHNVWLVQTLSLQHTDTGQTNINILLVNNRCPRQNKIENQNSVCCGLTLCLTYFGACLRSYILHVRATCLLCQLSFKSWAYSYFFVFYSPFPKICVVITTCLLPLISTSRQLAIHSFYTHILFTHQPSSSSVFLYFFGPQHACSKFL